MPELSAIPCPEGLTIYSRYWLKGGVCDWFRCPSLATSVLSSGNVVGAGVEMVWAVNLFLLSCGFGPKHFVLQSICNPGFGENFTENTG